MADPVELPIHYEWTHEYKADGWADSQYILLTRQIGYPGSPLYEENMRVPLAFLVDLLSTLRQKAQDEDHPKLLLNLTPTSRSLPKADW